MSDENEVNPHPPDIRSNPDDVFRIDDLRAMMDGDSSSLNLIIEDGYGAENHSSISAGDQRLTISYMEENNITEVSAAQLSIMLDGIAFQDLGVDYPIEFPDRSEAYQRFMNGMDSFRNTSDDMVRSHMLGERAPSTPIDEALSSNQDSVGIIAHDSAHSSHQHGIGGAYSVEDTYGLTRDLSEATGLRVGTVHASSNEYSVIQLGQDQMGAVSAALSERGIPHLVGDNVSAILIDMRMPWTDNKVDAVQDIAAELAPYATHNMQSSPSVQNEYNFN
ncbi:MAG: hypothetical protein ACRBDI_10175 [Alphaproteobacteria bacterium]